MLSLFCCLVDFHYKISLFGPFAIICETILGLQRCSLEGLRSRCMWPVDADKPVPKSPSLIGWDVEYTGLRRSRREQVEAVVSLIVPLLP